MESVDYVMSVSAYFEFHTTFNFLNFLFNFLSEFFSCFFLPLFIFYFSVFFILSYCLLLLFTVNLISKFKHFTFH